MKRWALVLVVLFGLSCGLVSPAADFDGDGTNDIGIFRASSGLWSIRDITRVYFGSSDDEPMPGDYNGDGTVDVGIFRGGSGLWAVRGLTRVYYGSSTDDALIGVLGARGGSGGLWNQTGSDIYYNAGNVGIGTDSPEELLHVNGNLRIPNGFDIINDEGRAVFHTGWRGDFGDYSVIHSGYDWEAANEPVSVVAGRFGVFFTRGDGAGNPFAATLMEIDTDGNVEVNGVLRQTLPKTGQTYSHRTGDDGDLEKGQTVLVDNSDGTVTDSRTGLMWPKDGTGAGYYSGGTRTWNQAIDWANDLSFADQTGWRLPNINELKSFQEVTWGHYQEQPTGYYWSSTSFA